MSKRVGECITPENLLRRLGFDTEMLSEYHKAENPPKERRDLSHDRASISPTEGELGIVKFAAQLEARYGTSFLWLDLIEKRNLFCNHLHLFDFYGLVDSYKQVLLPYMDSGDSMASLLARFFHSPPVEKLEEGVETATTAMIDLDAFVAGVDSFAHMDYKDYSLKMPRPKPLSLIVNQLTETPPVNQYGAQDIQPADPPLCRISLVELDIIKLTAQFVARYGPSFRRALMRRVAMKPHFEFLSFCIFVRLRSRERRLWSKLKAGTIFSLGLFLIMAEY